MFIDRYSPLKEIDLIGRDMEKIFSEFFPIQSSFSPAIKSSEKRRALPALDMIDRGDAIVVKVEVPGIKKEDIAISVEKNTLKLTADRKRKDEQKDEKFYHMERNHSRLERSVRLPVKIDQDNIKARLTDGVLEITLSKAKELQPKKIKVDVN